MSNSWPEKIAALRALLHTQVSTIVITGLAVQLLNLLSGPLVARMLGPEGRGLVMVVFLFATIGAQLGTSSLMVSIAHFVASAGGSARDLLRRSLPLWFMWPIVPAAGCASAVYVITSEQSSRPLLVALTLAITLIGCWTNVVIGMLHGELAVKKVNALRLLNTGTYVVLITGLFVFFPTRDAWVVLAALLASMSLCLLMSWRNLRHPSGDRSKMVNRRDVHSMARRTFVSSVGPAALGLDYLAVGVLSTPAQLGYYAVAGSASTLPVMVLSGVAGMLVPKMAALSEVASTTLMRKWIAGSVAVAVALALGLQVIIAPAISVLFGQEFIPAISCARILIIAWMFLAIRRVLTAAAQAQGRGGGASAIELISTGALAVAAPIGVVVGGIDGAAIGLLLVSLTNCLALCSIISWRVRRAPRDVVSRRSTMQTDSAASGVNLSGDATSRQQARGERMTSTDPPADSVVPAPESLLQRLSRRLRWGISDLWPNRWVERDVAGVLMAMPWSHRLPYYVRHDSAYGENLTQLAQILGREKPINILDVGANIGDSTMLILERIEARVLAIEPDEVFLPFLRHNLGRNNRVVIEPSLLLPSDTNAHFSRARAGGTASFTPSDDGLALPTVSVDELHRRHPEFSDLRLVKSDTDGFDVALVPAIARQWSGSRPVLFFEYDHGASKAVGNDPLMLWDELIDLGYTECAIWDNGGHPLHRTTTEGAVLLARQVEPSAPKFWDIAVAHRSDKEGMAALDELIPRT